MMSITLLAAGFLATLSAAAPITAALTNGTCERGLHLVVARGTLEPNGPGHMGRVAFEVAKAIPGSTISIVNYPASIDYFGSEALGIDALSMMILQYSSKCPKNRIALLGYSQVCSTPFFCPRRSNKLT